jgi:hypothetical protein
MGLALICPPSPPNRQYKSSAIDPLPKFVPTVVRVSGGHGSGKAFLAGLKVTPKTHKRVSAPCEA